MKISKKIKISLLSVLICPLLLSCGSDSDGDPNPNPNPNPDPGGQTTVISDTYQDPATGLMWQEEKDYARYNWFVANGIDDRVFNTESLDICGSLLLEGFDDWRLPSRQELFTVTHRLRDPNETGATTFPQTLGGNYWSSDEYVVTTANAWPVNFSDGGSTWPGWGNKGFEYGVVCVRGTPYPAADISDNGDATVKDNITGLTWQQQDDNQTYEWIDAVNYCANLSLSQYTDWRLPSVNELISITDLSTSNPAINSIFTNTKPLPYWSATERQSDKTNAWPVHFSDGHISNYVHFKTEMNYVRCVRGQYNFEGW